MLVTVLSQEMLRPQGSLAANFDFDTYQVGDGWARYRISIGEYVSAGTYTYLTIHNDDDQYESSNSYYRDIRLFEGATTHRVTHTYDAFNQWITRAVDPDGDSGSDPIERTAFVYDAGQIILQFDDTGIEALDAADLSHRYLWGPAVDQLLADEAVDSAVDQLFAFTGRPLDESTNLQNNLHRWYDAAIGQWTSEDPIGFAASDPNLRRYVKNLVTSTLDVPGRILIAFFAELSPAEF